MLKDANQKRILTGDNATGRLHLGHFVGSLENRVRLQHEYDTFIILADAHALAYPKYVENPSVILDSTYALLAGYLAVGLDPQRCTFFVESAVPEIYEFAALLSMFISHNRVLRNPTIKEEIKEKNLGDNYSLGFINFPVLMAADILALGADLVPVGEDQLPHLELTTELARRINAAFGPTLIEPEALVGRVARLVGTDGGAKMTKSLNNAIFLDDTEEDLKQKVMSMYTDPNRIRATDPGRVEGNPVFIYHDTFNPNKNEVADLKERYLVGKVGDVEVKEKLFIALNSVLAPIRQRYHEVVADKIALEAILHEGNARTRTEAEKMLQNLKRAIGLF